MDISRIVAVALSGVCACAGLAVAAGCSSGENATESVAAGQASSPSVPASQPSSSSSSTDTGPSPAPTITRISVGYLPAGAVDSGQSAVPGLPGGGLFRAFALAGPANVNTIPAGGPTDANAASVHPADLIQIYATPGVTELPSLYSDPANGILQTTADVNGQQATVTYPATYGILKIDWVANGVMFEVREWRGHTAEGTSGVDQPTLLQVARSVTVS